MSWQTMDSFPRDGSAFLVRRSCKGSVEVLEAEWHEADGDYLVVGNGRGWIKFTAFTHWSSLRTTPGHFILPDDGREAG